MMERAALKADDILKTHEPTPLAKDVSNELDRIIRLAAEKKTWIRKSDPTGFLPHKNVPSLVSPGMGIQIQSKQRLPPLSPTKHTIIIYIFHTFLDKNKMTILKVFYLPLPFTMKLLGRGKIDY